MVNKNELVITRIFDAPRELVWKMWTEPELFKKWWGPKMFSCPVSKIDFKVGGKYLHCMRGLPGLPPEMAGKDFWNTGTYTEIVPNKKIVYLDSFGDEQGNVVPASQYGMAGFPDQMQVTVVFEEENGKTKMTLTHEGIANANPEMLKNMDQGWNESFDKIVDGLK